jgi:hypothetical protein
MSNPQAEEPPLVGCPHLLIQYIHSYPPRLEPPPEGMQNERNIKFKHFIRDLMSAGIAQSV